MKKNVAGQYLSVSLVNVTTGAALTGASVTVRRNLDGTEAAATGSVSEPNSDGKYLLALSQADTNGDCCSYFFTAANAIPVCVNVHTSFPQTIDNPSAATIAAAILATPAQKLTTGTDGGAYITGTKSTLDSLADFDPASDKVMLADDTIRADAFDESTAFPQTAADVDAMVLP